MSFTQMKTEDLIALLAQHPGALVVIEDPDVCLVVTDKIQVAEVEHQSLGKCVALAGLFPVKQKHQN